MRFNRYVTFVVTLLLFSALGCSNRNRFETHHPLVAAQQGQPQIEQKTLSTQQPSANPSVPSSSSVQVKMTLNKAALFGQEFMYSADLQYSTLYDAEMDLYNQSLVLGNWPASFVIAGNELQLIAITKYKFPSDVNHPAQLIARYEILSQDDATLTVSAAHSAKFLALQLSPLTQAKTSTVLDSWVRSVDYVEKGSYLLQQSSVQLSDGTISEVMESVFPRATLAPGKDFKAFKMDPSSADGAAADSPKEVSRFRFLPGDTVFTGEDKHAWAQHFDLSPGEDGTPATIDWYVTPNIPDQYLEPVKEAIEGWNRYFRSYAGFKRDVVLFKGRLPQGVYLGDPRYNVVNWDSRLVAGAAYESQSTDPETGKQSHSVIYMPAAWLQIGTDYWKIGRFSDSDAASGRSARARCFRNLSDAAMIAASGRLSRDEVEKFGVEIFKQTLFHEVGHALGLAHNFKGSLSWDRTKAGSIFSTSIMDYNDYEIERAAFSGVDSADGPLLEYDRQALSALYDSSRDVASGDPVVPTCNDAEADAEAGGVDPLCIRYDNASDPTQSVTDAYRRVTDASIPNDVTLSEALARVPSLAFSAEKVAAIQTAKDMQVAAAAFGAQLKGSLAFYVVAGKMSISRATRLNLKSLFEFADGVLPEGYDERGMRERAFAGVQNSLKLMSLPRVVTDAANAAISDGLSKLSQSPAIRAMNSSDRESTMAALQAKLSQGIASFEQDENLGLPKLRLTVLASLSRHEDVPFFLGKLGDARQDYETAIVGMLTDIVSNSNRDPSRRGSERVIAAKALATYKGRLPADSAMKYLKALLIAEQAAASDNQSRETIETILKVLRGK